MAKCDRCMVEPDRQRLPRLGPVELDRRDALGFGGHVQLGLVDLHPSRSLHARDRATTHLEHGFRQEVDGLVEHDLRESLAVTQDEERDVGEPALPVKPSLQEHRLGRVRGELAGENAFHRRHLPSDIAWGCGRKAIRGATALRACNRLLRAPRCGP